MKEGDPKKIPFQEKIKGLVNKFGCEPDSVIVKRDAKGRRLFSILGATLRENGEPIPVIIKAAAEEITQALLKNEANVLRAIPRDYLEERHLLVPELKGDLTETNGLTAIMISELPRGEEATLVGFIWALETFRQMKIPKEMVIETVEPEDYFWKGLTRLRFLRRMGWLKGLSEREFDYLQELYSKKWQLLELYDTVFVHGDFRKDHLWWAGEELAAADYDKSVRGNELQDPAWFSARHPESSKEMVAYLKQRFRNNGEKLACLDKAFPFMQVDRLTEALYTRTSQWRGNWDTRSYLQKAYGRMALNDRLRALIETLLRK
jgi:hypothetical protein